MNAADHASQATIAVPSTPVSPKQKTTSSPAQRKTLAHRKAKELKPPSPKKVLKVKKTKMPANHPLYIDMVKKAIKDNTDKKGTSRQTINKYVAEHFQLGNNTVMINHGITRAIRRALQKKIIVQAAGSGARGRFRMSENGETTTKATKTVKKASDGAKPAKKAGRPKKVVADGEKKVAAATDGEKKKAGRPKKTAAKTPKVPMSAAKIPKVVDPSQPKKKAGRPPKTPKE